jgi:tetratricopeptide (TPR) repeat protein/tRNA A-37 threonylcarbamoyl transferase component Bud32
MDTDPSGRAAETLPDRDLLGKTVGRYRIDAKIGVGGTADVFKAWDPLLKRPVAFKRLTAGTVGDDENRHRILREARALAALKHPSITFVYDVLEEDGELFLVEELVSGSPLNDLLKSPLPLAEFFVVAEGCLEALRVAVEQGIVHCDLKPGNIVLTRKGIPKILDFGLAQRLPVDETQKDSFTDSTLDVPTVAPRIAGTAGYMAPEVVRGRVADERADIFALGVVFYEMLTARHPFRKSTRSETMVSVLTDIPPEPSEINGTLPPGFDDLVSGMLAREPTERIASAQEALVELQKIRIAHEGLLRPEPQTRVWVRGIGAGLLGAALLLGGRALFDSVQPRDFDGYLLVAPFENLTPDPSMDYLATGFTEAVQVRLSGIGGIYVVDADSKIGTRLLLEGGVQQAGDVLRVTYRIVDREGGVNVHADEVQGKIQDLFKLQNLLALGVSEALADEFPVEPLPAEEPPPTEEATAYDLYLRGRGYLRDFDDPDNVTVAMRMFERALAEDADFLLARTGLGEAWWRHYEHTKESADARRAEEIGRAVIEAGPKLPEAHVTLGTVYLGTGRPERAAAEFERALEIDPRSEGAYLGLARSQADRGNLEAAERTYRRAIDARPAYWNVHNELGKFYYRNGRLPEAIAEFTKVVEITPRNARGLSNLGAMHYMGGDREAAEEAYRRSLEARPSGPALNNLATLLKSQGRYEEAATVYETAIAESPNDYRIWGNLGGVYSLLPSRSEERLEAYRRAIVLGEAELEVNPNNPNLQATMAQWYALVGRELDARDAVDRALEIAPGSLDVLQYLAGPLIVIGDTTRALAILRTAFENGLPVDMILNEPSLATIHEHSEFQRMVREFRSAENDE